MTPDQYQKDQLLREFRDVVVADTKLNPNEWFNNHPGGWPDTGGPRYQYWYKRRGDGTEVLENAPNTQTIANDYQENSRPASRLGNKGYVRITDPDELLAIVDRQQAAVRAKWEKPEPEAPARKARRSA